LSTIVTKQRRAVEMAVMAGSEAQANYPSSDLVGD
jgi:hypothetical protein